MHVVLLAVLVFLVGWAAAQPAGNFSGHWRRSYCNCDGANASGYAQCDDLWLEDYPIVYGPRFISGANYGYSSNISAWTLWPALAVVWDSAGPAWGIVPFPRSPGRRLPSTGYLCRGSLVQGPFLCHDGNQSVATLYCTVQFACVSGPCMAALAAVAPSSSNVFPLAFPFLGLLSFSFVTME